MSIQVHCFGSQDTPSNAGTEYIAPLNGQYFSATEHNGTCICTAAGTFGNFSITLTSAPGVGKSYTFTLRKNQVDTAAVITISGASVTGTYVASSIAIADGDELTIKSVPSGTPTASAASITWRFTSTTTKEGIHGSGNENGIVGIARYGGFFFRGDVTNFGDSAAIDQKEVCSTPGSCTKWTVKLDTTVPAASTVVCVLFKNGVIQDGTSGSANTTISLSTGAQKASATFTMAIAAGDYFNIRVTPTGTASPKPIFGLKFVSTNEGEYNYSSQLQIGPSNSATNYGVVGNGSATATNATEANIAVTTGQNRFRLSNLFVRINTSLLSGGSYAYTLRKNGADTNLTTTITTGGGGGTDVANSDVTHNASFVSGDTLDMKVIPTSSPSSRFPSWSMTMNFIGAGKGAGGTKGPAFGGGAGQIIQPGGCVYMSIGNAGVDIGTTS